MDTAPDLYLDQLEPLGFTPSELAVQLQRAATAPVTVGDCRAVLAALTTQEAYAPLGEFLAGLDPVHPLIGRVDGNLWHDRFGCSEGGIPAVLSIDPTPTVPAPDGDALWVPCRECLQEMGESGTDTLLEIAPLMRVITLAPQVEQDDDLAAACVLVWTLDAALGKLAYDWDLHEPFQAAAAASYQHAREVLSANDLVLHHALGELTDAYLATADSYEQPRQDDGEDDLDGLDEWGTDDRYDTARRVAAAMELAADGNAVIIVPQRRDHYPYAGLLHTLAGESIHVDSGGDSWFSAPATSAAIAVAVTAGDTRYWWEPAEVVGPEPTDPSVIAVAAALADGGMTVPDALDVAVDLAHAR